LRAFPRAAHDPAGLLGGGWQQRIQRCAAERPDSLTALSLENNLLADTAGLARSHQSGHAWPGSQTRSPTPLSLANWPSLTLYSNRLGTLDSLSAIKRNLNCLNAAANPLTNLSALSALTNLSSLSLFADGISPDCSILTHALTTLDLGANRIQIFPRCKLIQSPVANLSSNLITDPRALRRIHACVPGCQKKFEQHRELVFPKQPANLTVLGVKACSLSDLSFAMRCQLCTSWTRLEPDHQHGSVSGLTPSSIFLAGYNRSRDLSPLSALARLWHADMRTNLLI